MVFKRLPGGIVATQVWSTAWFTQSRGGFHAYWKLSEFYNLAGLVTGSGNGSVWVHKGLVAWAKLLNSSGLEGHIMRSRPHGSGGGVADSSERCLRWPAISTGAMIFWLALLTGGTSRFCGLARESKDKMINVVRIIFSVIAAEEWDLQLLIDEDVDVSIPQLPQGRQPIILTVSEGMINFDPLLTWAQDQLCATFVPSSRRGNLYLASRSSRPPSAGLD